MDLLAKSDDEIFAIAKPFWENLVRASNMKDYGGFTKDFSTGCIENVQMHFSKIKIPQKILNKKTTFIKTGIFSAIVACWGVILVGTFVTFK